MATVLRVNKEKDVWLICVRDGESGRGVQRYFWGNPTAASGISRTKCLEKVGLKE